MDIITIIYTGIYSIGCITKIRKEKNVGETLGILAAIGSFVFCLDLIIAIALYIKNIVDRIKKIIKEKKEKKLAKMIEVV